MKNLVGSLWQCEISYDNIISRNIVSLEYPVILVAYSKDKRHDISYDTNGIPYVSMHTLKCIKLYQKV